MPIVDPFYLETIALHAWPAAEIVDLDGWRLRHAGGVTRRANSVWPNAAAGRLSLDEKIAAAEAFYAGHGQPAIFQISPAAQPAELDAILAARGYAHHAPTLVQTAALTEIFRRGGAEMQRNAEEEQEQASAHLSVSAPPRQDFAVTLASHFDPGWFELYCVGEEAPPMQAAVRQAILRRIDRPCAYVTLHRDGAPIAVALGVVEAGWLGIFNVVTLPAYRRQGAARALLAALAAWATDHGAIHAYLQVMARNTAARALYAAAGFTTAYGYHYRVKEVG
jgi:predicted GNAT family acetyltransferase